MWAAGVVDLGLTTEVFWSLTPREFSLLFERHLDREERANQRAGLIASFIANYAGRQRDERKHPRPFTVQEITPSRHSRNGHMTAPAHPLEPEQSLEDMIASLKSFVPDGKGKWGSLADEQ